MTPRLVVPIPDPMLVTLLTKAKPLGTVIHRPVQDIPHTRIPAWERDKEVCMYTETDQFGNVVRKCYNKVFKGRSGFLCKMHHDGDVRMKPQLRTIYADPSDYEESKLRLRMQREVATAEPVLSYSQYVQWGWSRQPILMVQDRFGNLAQAFYDPFEEEEES